VVNDVLTTGWLDQPDGRLVFVLPHETLGARDDEHIVFQPERFSPAHDALAARGTLEDWQNNVGALCEHNPVLVIGVCLALAAPLLKPAALENGGLHWYGRTSRGKTTSLRVIASVIGSGAHPNTGRAAVQYWNATANALEALAAAYNDLLLPRDVIDECDAADFGMVIFRLIGGRGRARLDKLSDLMPVRTWRNLIVSTGEIPVWQKIEQDRRTARGGQRTRLADVPVAERIFQDLHGRPSEREIADELQRACERHYGALLPAFLRAVIAEYEVESALARHVLAALDAEAGQLSSASGSPEQSRVIRRIALASVAGQMAHELRVLPWSVEMIHLSAQCLVRLYLADSASVPDHVRGVWAVCDGLKRHRARLRDLRKGDTPPNLLGYRKASTKEAPELVLLTPGGLAELCEGRNDKDVLREFDRLGVLHKTEADRFASKHEIDGARQRLYAFRFKELMELETRQGSDVDSPDGASGANGASP
jgi:putative DNA primase/helicase